MGMDVIGKAPTAEVGGYFRNNVWWWRPLADYILALHAGIAEGCTHWHTNDGDGLDAAGALALADALDRDLADGTTERYADDYAAELASLPKQRCDLCDGTGIRDDEIGRLHGFDKPRDPATGQGGCNGCNGRGEREHFATSYPFDIENVREFAAFLRHCGGFSIW